VAESASQTTAQDAPDTAQDAPATASNTVTATLLRIGLGVDTHALCHGRELTLGGVRIAHPLGLDGHSDADVLLHAIMDALLGAMRLEGACDIGALFPNNDPAYAGANSLVLLSEVGELVNREGYVIIDIDSVIVAQAPRLSGYRDAMRENIAAALQVPVSNIGVKATTTEHLGFEGREEGISATAVALLQKG
jgi:2-C-methyl-D-erythritol 2,4-cyclodiphosphate synthase